MSIRMVNGYACTNCAEAAEAAKGINPANTAAQAPPEPKVDAAAGDARPRAPLPYASVMDKLA